MNTTELNPRKLAQRRERTRNCMRKRRLSEKEATERNHHSEREQKYKSQEQSDENSVNSKTLHEKETGPCDSPSSEIYPSTSQESVNSTLKVKLTFNNNINKKRERKAYRMAKKNMEAKLSKITHTNDALRTKLSRQTQRTEISIQRGQGEKTNTNLPGNETTENPSVQNNAPRENGKSSRERKRKYIQNDVELSTLTPKSKSKEELRMEGLSPSKYPKIVKKLFFHNSLVNELNESIKQTRGRRRERSVIQSQRKIN